MFVLITGEREIKINKYGCDKFFYLNLFMSRDSNPYATEEYVQ